MIKKLIALVVGLLATTCISAKELKGYVVDVIDGDTIKIYADDKKIYTIRLYGIDTPERGQHYYNEAKEALQKFILSKDVLVYYTKNGIYGRIIGKIYYNGKYINQDMIHNGYAWYYEKYAKNNISLKEAQDSAIKLKAGIWSQEKPIPPWKWRKGERNNNKKYWLNNVSNIRHNNLCTHYKTNNNGRDCSQSEGQPCKICEK